MAGVADSERGERAAGLYLDLLKGCLTRSLFHEEEQREVQLKGLPRRIWGAYRRAAKHPDWSIVRPDPEGAKARLQGKGWAAHGETMLSEARLDNIQHCVTSVIADGIPGDVIETGVWRGGAAILSRAVLAAYGVTDRTVWVADSFEGLPAPDPERYPGDAGLGGGRKALAVSLEDVQANFSRYGLLDDQVKFLVGWFKDTLPGAPIEQLAVARLDGDLYESTIDAISVLYPKLSVGGYLIVDDYGAPKLAKACRQAITDYREEHGITEAIHEIDWTGVYWRRESA